MKRDLIVLTMSDKNKRYCIAGIDVVTGEWIRLVTDDMKSNGGLSNDDLQYEDGSYCEIFDCIEVEVKRSDSWIQPENYEINTNIYIKKIRKYSLADIIKIHEPEIHNYLLGNEWNYITEAKVSTIGYSLAFVYVKDLVLHNELNKYSALKTKADFFYNNIHYKNVSVTDSDFYREGTFGEAFLVVSLPEISSNGKYYKCIAKIYIVDHMQWYKHLFTTLRLTLYGRR